MIEIKKSGFRAKIEIDEFADNPLDYGDFRLHVFWNEGEILGHDLDEKLNLSELESLNCVPLWDILCKLSGEKSPSGKTTFNLYEIIKQQGKYLVYLIRVKSYVNSDPLMMELTENICVAGGLLYAETENINLVKANSYNETLIANKDYAKEVLSNWLAYMNNEMLISCIFDAANEPETSIGSIFTTEQAIEESKALIEEFRGQELKRLAKENPEAAVISFIREKCFSSETDIANFLSGEMSYTMNLVDVQESLNLKSIPPSDWYGIELGKIKVCKNKVKFNKLRDLYLSLETDFTEGVIYEKVQLKKLKIL